jgi:phosphate transport system permease protein
MQSDSILRRRQTFAKFGNASLFLSLAFALFALLVLFTQIADQIGGYTVTQYSVDPATLADKPLDQLSVAELGTILKDNLSEQQFGALVVSSIDKLDAKTKQKLLDDLLKPPPEETLTGGPKLEELTGLELVTLINERIDPSKVYEFAGEVVDQKSKDELIELIRSELLKPVDESLVSSKPLEELNTEELIRILTEQLPPDKAAALDFGELSQQSQLELLEKVRGEALAAPDESSISETPLEELEQADLAQIIKDRFAEPRYIELAPLIASDYPIERLVETVKNELLLPLDPTTINSKPLESLTSDALYEAVVANADEERQNTFVATALMGEATDSLLRRVEKDVLQPSIKQTWGLFRSIFDEPGVKREIDTNYSGAKVEWKWWLTPQFFTRIMSSVAENSGIRTAILGSLWLVVLTMLIAVPLGVGAAIYLEEYAGNSRLSRWVQLNIYNLAGIPSIIYGMLGLAIFVRAMGDIMGITSGAVFGVTDTNGRTILSAAMTMALLILPLIIVNAQEAIRSVPSALREASYGVGATKLQTIWHHVLPYALPGILTGSILAMSRTIGETAPLIVIGASTFAPLDPSSPFSKFTVLPIQIYRWTSEPAAPFKNIAATGSFVLLAMLVLLNLTAIVLRNRYRKQRV